MVGCLHVAWDQAKETDSDSRYRHPILYQVERHAPIFLRASLRVHHTSLIEQYLAQSSSGLGRNQSTQCLGNPDERTSGEP